jgi:hypothetical protein
MSSVPKYSVVPGSVLMSAEPRFSEVVASDELEVCVFELVTQLGCLSHKETEFVVFIFSESLLRFVFFCVLSHQF